jgi:hypothetical protein
MIAAVLLLMTSALAISALGQEDGAERAASKAIIQYKLVEVPGVMTQSQFQSVLTTQGNAGWRFLGPYAVGTAPIPTQTVLLFSKP